MRSAEEARAAIAGGASIVDVKEPANGPLGGASLAVRAAVAGAACQAGAPVTAAAGELGDGPPWMATVRGISHHKVGLAGCANVPDWKSRLDVLRRALEEGDPAARLIAVAYADHLAALAPPPADVAAYAAATGLDAVLIDTFEKRSGSIRALLPERDLAGFIARARAGGAIVAVAGSLGAPDIPHLLSLGADVIAVRGAACRGGRDGAVDAALVARLAAAVVAGRERRVPAR